MRHTPGPWVVYDDWYIKSADGKGSHATVHNPLQPNISNDEHRANAILIASAPTLLERLRSFIDLIEMDDEAFDPSTDLYVELTLERLAIASATLSDTSKGGDECSSSK